MNPGMMLRIDQSSVEGFKNGMSRFLPHYITTDYEMPKDYHYEFGFFFDFLTWHSDLTDITYGNPHLDIKDVEFAFSREVEDPRITFNFPAIKNWTISANQTIDTWIPWFNGPLRIELVDLAVDITTDLKLDKNGNIDPEVYNVNVNFGGSNIYHENWFAEIVFWQATQYAMVVIETAAPLVGHMVLDDMVGPLLDTYLTHYMLEREVSSPIQGQDTKSTLVFDYRNVQQPYIGDKFVEFRFLGELMHKTHKNGKDTYIDCPMKPDALEFIDHEVFSQLVVSEQAANCIAQSISQSTIGKLTLTTEKLNAMFDGDNSLEFTSSSLAPHIPFFQDKLGKDIPLKFVASFKNMNVSFGVDDDTDVALHYVACLDWYQTTPGSSSDWKRLFYDEIKMTTHLNAKIEQDVIITKITSQQMDRGKHSAYDRPETDKMSLSKQDYREYISTFGLAMAEMRSWLNDAILLDGIELPFRMDEMKTKLEFRKKALHVMIEVEDGSGEFFEDEFWDEEYKEEKEEEESM